MRRILVAMFLLISIFISGCSINKEPNQEIEENGLAKKEYSREEIIAAFKKRIDEDGVVSGLRMGYNPTVSDFAMYIYDLEKKSMLT